MFVTSHHHLKMKKTILIKNMKVHEKVRSCTENLSNLNMLTNAFSSSKLVLEQYFREQNLIMILNFSFK